MYISGLDRGRMQWFCTEEFDSCCVLLPDGHHQETLYHSSTSVSDVLEQITERCELGSKASSKLILMKGETPHVLASQTLLLDILQADDYSDDSAQGRLQAKRFFASDAMVGSTKLVFWSFLQARAEYLAGWYPAPDETVVQLAILLARYSLSQSSFGDETQLKENLPNFMPKQVCLLESCSMPKNKSLNSLRRNGTRLERIQKSCQISSQQNECLCRKFDKNFYKS